MEQSPVKRRRQSALPRSLRLAEYCCHGDVKGVLDTKHDVTSTDVKKYMTCHQNALSNTIIMSFNLI